MPGLDKAIPAAGGGTAMTSGSSIVFIVIIFTIYLLAVLFVSNRRKNEPATAGSALSAISADEYFLGGRNLGWLSLLLTTAATNFSAFTVLGLSGAGYRIGYAFYPAMAFGTGFMALGIYLIGVPLREEGSRRSWTTPVDPVRDRFASPALARLYAACLVLFTLPYLALQPMAAGLLLESAYGLPYRAGAVLVAALIAFYTARGGLRSLVRTDAFHGFLLAVLAAAAWVAVTSANGGLAQVHGSIASRMPELLSRHGIANAISPLGLAGYYLLWFLADPMFPQLGQRFLASRDRRSLEKVVTVYPLVTTVLFFFTIAVGVTGAVVLPGLSSADSDRVWLLMMMKTVGPALSSLFLLAPLAALVSTMDSQLLTLASIIAREFSLPAGHGRRLVPLIAAAGALIAMFPPADILSFLNRTSFIGYAALAPTAFGALYSRRGTAFAAFASILAGESAVILSGLRILVIPGVPEIFPVAALSWGVWYAATSLGPRKTVATASFTPWDLKKILPLPWALAFAAIALLTLDFWNWDKKPILLGGFPLWMLGSAGAGIALSGLFALFFFNRSKRPAGSVREY